MPTSRGLRPKAFGLALLALAALFLPAFSCTQTYYLDYKEEPKIEPPSPEELAAWLREYRAGRETWRGDPRAVADAAIRHYLDVPWKADPFRPAEYALKQNAELGTHVVRGYFYPSGHQMRYRVVVRQHEDIWYPTRVSRYKEVTLQHPALED